MHGSVVVHGRVQGEKAHTLTGQGQRLAIGIAVDRVGIECGQKRHLHPAVDQLAVRLVGDDVDRMTVARLLFAQHGAQRRKLRTRDDDTGGIVRGVEDEQRGLFRHSGGERLKIEREGIRLARHDAHTAARRLGIDGVLREIRCEHDGLIPRAEERARQDRQRARRAVGHVDILRAVRLAECLREVGRDLFTHRRHARRGRIGVQLRGRHGMQQALNGRVHTVRRVDTRAADGKVIDVFRADLGRAALAVGRDLADGIAVCAPVEHLFRDHAFASSRYCFRYKIACR